MANTLKIKRGTKATIPTLAAGEPGWVTDTHELFVGGGATNYLVGGEKITTIASSATPTPTGGSTRNLFTVTALAVDATFAVPSGTPANGNKLIIRILDNGTSRSLAWNAIYGGVGITLPATTTTSKYTCVGAIYNSQSSKWDCVATVTQA